jgi:ubiquinone/menaquinone biosynthesis C-methylase UbiE
MTYASTMSTSSWSIRTPDDEDEGDYKWMDSRRFQDWQTKNPWLVPEGDTSELARLNFQHRLSKMQFDGNYKAPVREILISGGNVLHAGCGNGAWLMEMALDFPRATFIGIDIGDNIFPPRSAVPPNCKFYKANLLDRLPFQDNTFDFVHQRFLSFFLRESQFPDVVRELVRVTREGGFVELMESEIYLHNAGPICHEQFNKKTRHALHANGLNPLIALRLKDLLHECHLVNVQNSYASVPTGFGGPIGELSKRFFLAEWFDRRDFLMFALVMTAEELDETLEACFQELNDEHKVYMNTYYAYARKAIQI